MSEPVIILEFRLPHTTTLHVKAGLLQEYGCRSMEFLTDPGGGPVDMEDQSMWMHNKLGVIEATDEEGHLQTVLETHMDSSPKITSSVVVKYFIDSFGGNAYVTVHMELVRHQLLDYVGNVLVRLFRDYPERDGMQLEMVAALDVFAPWLHQSLNDFLFWYTSEKERADPEATTGLTSAFFECMMKARC